MANDEKRGKNHFDFSDLFSAIAGVIVGGGLRGGGGQLTPGQHGMTGFFTSFFEFIIKVWKEKGGSLEDEGSQLETMYSSFEEGEKLDVDERKSVEEVRSFLSPDGKKMFRLVLFILRPEIMVLETPETKDANGKVIPAQRSTKKSGYNPRISVLKGIAAAAKANGAETVAKQLENSDVLGKANMSIQAYRRIRDTLKSSITKYFGVESFSEITLDMVKAKLAEEAKKSAEVPVVKMGAVERVFNWLTIGPKSQPAPMEFPWRKKK